MAVHLPLGEMPTLGEGRKDIFGGLIRKLPMVTHMGKVTRGYGRGPYMEY